MALVGNCYNITYSEHPTETEIQTWVLPDGTEGSDIVPKRVEQIETYENIYLVITQVENFNRWGMNWSNKNIISFYRAYESAEIRNENQENYLFEGNIGFNPNFELPLYGQIYSEIKKIQGFETLIDG